MSKSELGKRSRNTNNEFVTDIVENFKSNIETMSPEDVFVAEVDIEGCLIHGKFLHPEFKNPVNDKLLEVLELMKNLVESRGNVFQVNICSTIPFKLVNDELQSKIFELNNHKPIFQVVIENEQSVNANNEVVISSRERMKMIEEVNVSNSVTEDENQQNIAVGKRVVEHDLNKPQVFNDLSLSNIVESGHGVLLKVNSLDLSVISRAIAKKYKSENDTSKSIMDIQADIWRGDIEISEDFRDAVIADQELLTSLSKQTCFIDNDSRYCDDVKKASDKGYLSSMSMVPCESAMIFDSAKTIAEVQKMPIEETHSYYEDSQKMGKYHYTVYNKNINQVVCNYSFEVQENQAFVYLPDLEQQLQLELEVAGSKASSSAVPSSSTSVSDEEDSIPLSKIGRTDEVTTVNQQR